MVSHLAKYRKVIPALALIFALIDTQDKNGKLADRDGVLLDSFTIRHFYQKHWAGRCAQGRRRAGGF